MVSFISKNIFTHFCILKILIIDNEMQFSSSKFKEFYRKWEIDFQLNLAYLSQTNSMTEVTNKIILQGLKKRLEQVKGIWSEELPPYHLGLQNNSTISNGRNSTLAGIRG